MYFVRESVAALLDVLHQQVLDWFARLDARLHHPTRSVLSKPYALLSLCEELREETDGRVENRLSTGSAAIVAFACIIVPKPCPKKTTFMQRQVLPPRLGMDNAF